MYFLQAKILKYLRLVILQESGAIFKLLMALIQPMCFSIGKTQLCFGFLFYEGSEKEVCISNV